MFFRPAPPPEASAGHPALDLSRQLDCIIGTILYWLGFARLGRFAFPLQCRIMRANERLASLLRRIAEGTFRAPRARAATIPPRKGGKPAPYLPRRIGWLGIAAGFQMRNVASQLQSLLAAPQTLATIAEAPPQARLAVARALKTPCRLLGVDLPAILTPAGPPKPPRPPRPRAPRPAAAPLPPLRPLQSYVRAAVRAWKPRYG
jgi:hypothetical protein